MKSLLLIIMSLTVAAVNIILQNKPDHTTKYYRKALVFTLFDQNRFLSLPEKPALVFEGFYPIHVHAPLSINTYAWDLRGFYKAKQTGRHTFSIDRTKIAYIQIGWKKLKPQSYQEMTIDEYEHFLEPRTVFSNSPVMISLVEGNYYKVEIFYIAGAERVPIYVTEPTGFQQDLDSRIKEAVFDPLERSWTEELKPSKEYIIPSYYQTIGFFLVVYQIPNNFTDYENAHCDLSRFQKVHEGFFTSHEEKILLPQVTAPVIREVIGHFRPVEDGKYLIHMSGKHMACVQIGPKRGVQNGYYMVDNDWTILDTRGNTLVDLDLQISFFYPFRIVLLGNEKEFSLDITVYDSERKKVDLFGLWGGQASSLSVPLATSTTSLTVNNLVPYPVIQEETISSKIAIELKKVIIESGEPLASSITVSESQGESLEDAVTDSAWFSTQPIVTNGFSNESATQLSTLWSSTIG